MPFLSVGCTCDGSEESVAFTEYACTLVLIEYALTEYALTEYALTEFVLTE